MCPRIILNGKCNNKAARKLPCSRTIWYLQIDLGCKRILWGRMSSPFFLILYSLKGENTCTFYMLQGTLKVLLSTFLSSLPDCSHCWSAWHWGQKSNVPWSRVTIIAVSLWAGSLPKVLIQVIGKSSPEVVTEGDCKCGAHKIIFTRFEEYLGKAFILLFFFCEVLWFYKESEAKHCSFCPSGQLKEW